MAQIAQKRQAIEEERRYHIKKQAAILADRLPAERIHKLEEVKESFNVLPQDEADISQRTLYRHKNAKKGNGVASSHKKVAWQEDPTKILLVRDVPSQGVGNNLHGLLAALLLWEEFGRIMCVSKIYHRGFHAAFQHIHPLAATHCPTVWNKEILYYKDDEYAD